MDGKLAPFSSYFLADQSKLKSQSCYHRKPLVGQCYRRLPLTLMVAAIVVIENGDFQNAMTTFVQQPISRKIRTNVSKFMPTYGTMKFPQLRKRRIVVTKKFADFLTMFMKFLISSGGLMEMDLSVNK